MNTMKGKFTRIKGNFSEARILPRLGKIRLGVKVEKVGSKGPVQFPRETTGFVCPPEVEAVYGENPTELDVLLPSDDPEVVFQQKLVLYGSGTGIKCHGNGEQAERLNEQTRQFEPRTCPCGFLKTPENPKGQCTEKSSLMVILPTVSMGGCFQITTSSFHSTRNINSALDMARAVAGRIALLPMKLRRVAQETHHNGAKQIHYVLNLILNATWQQVSDMRSNPSSLIIPSQYQIEAPVDENPELDPVDEVEDDDDGVDAAAIADMTDKELTDVQAKLAEKRKGQGNGPEQSGECKGVAPPTGIAQQAVDASAHKTNGHVSTWTEIIAAVDAHPDYCTLKDTWKSAHGVDSIVKLKPAGQSSLLEFLRQNSPAFPY